MSVKKYLLEKGPNTVKAVEALDRETLEEMTLYAVMVLPILVKLQHVDIIVSSMDEVLGAKDLIKGVGDKICPAMEQDNDNFSTRN